ncbi:PDZ domain-containing protein, partial [bacterium]|nr:PDZ domain-containing protein [bacterium]
MLEGAPLVEELAAGLAIKEVLLDSLAEHLKLKPGDTIESLNGQPVRDAIDFHYNFNDDQVTLRLVRGDDTLVFEIEKEPDEVLGVIFEDMSILKCDNKCVFCFLHQMPKKLRKTLYYQDDDYRLSFLHGAYVTLTNLSDEEFDRIVSQRLSP